MKVEGRWYIIRLIEWVVSGDLLERFWDAWNKEVQLFQADRHVEDLKKLSLKEKAWWLLGGPVL